MDLKFTVQTRIQKPVTEVFDAIYNPDKLVKYFAESGVKGALDKGATAYWKFSPEQDKAVEVNVKEMEKNKRIVFAWPANESGEGKSDKPYTTTVEIIFEALSDKETMVKITESGWNDTAAGLAGSYQNCSGWSKMLASLKGWILNDFVLGMDTCH